MSEKTTTSMVVMQKKDKLPIVCMNDIATMGQFLAQSQMFGAKNQAEGMMIVGICQQEGWSYADFMANFDIIHGRLSKKPAAMLSDFEARGGTYEIVQRDPDGSIISFKKGKRTYKFECLWKDVMQEPLPYDCKEAEAVKMLAAGQTPPMKPKYATPRSRMQMLWARCVSDGLRAFDPSCCKGIYTPEEVDDFAPAPSYASPQTPVAPPPSPAPVQVEDVEVCPIGSMKGQRWDSMEVSLLKQALNVPAFPDNVKAYVRTVIERKEAKPDQPVEAEVVS